LGDLNSTWFDVPKLDEHASDGLTGTAGYVAPHWAQNCCQRSLQSVVASRRTSWHRFCVDPAFVFSTAGFVGPHCAQNRCRCLLQSVVVACRKTWQSICVDPAFVFSVVIVVVPVVVVVVVVFL
jgi:hypothetical protein